MRYLVSIIFNENSTDSETSKSVVSVACAVPAFIMPFIITVFELLFFIATITIGFLVGLVALLGCLQYDSGAAAIAYWLGSTLKAEWMIRLNWIVLPNCKETTTNSIKLRLGESSRASLLTRLRAILR